MSRFKPCSLIIFILILFILFHNALLIGLSNISSLFRENNYDILKEESYIEKIDYLEKKLASYESSLENLKIYDGQNYVLSKIALRDIYRFYNYLVVTTDSKVSEGDAVINEKGLVGIVESSNKTTAKVKLLTGNASISVKVDSSYGLLDEYDAENNLLIIHNINNYKEINEGSPVYTSGLSNIDEGLYIGKVYKTEKKGIEQIVYVKSEVDFDNLNYLYIITKG